MKPELKNCIHTNRIDSYQKLRLLLLLQKQPEQVITKAELARQLHLNDILLLGQLVTDLQQFGWLDDVDGNFTLTYLPKRRTCLQLLANVFDDPIARQELLDEVWHYPISVPIGLDR